MVQKQKARQNEFMEWITVSSKGQVSIPAHIRRKLHISVGDRLLIILRKEEDGINLIKKTALDNVFQKLSN
ncbi:MAG: AbrB/MazE/SpoVT family DNA-binding domain-containing protein [Candidatus Kerfeldbacteria bacterium]|nr:AbrB/MazE/SpoVT family DNA-binding domain-containing protein [Candidatus Kerfeldbacteria bacterium]